MAQRNVAVWVVACLLAFAGCAEESVAKVTRPSAYLVVDYLPAAIYDGDGLSACFRIENASGRDAAFEVTAKTVDSAGAEVRTQTEKAAVARAAFGAVKFELDAKRVATIHFELKKGGGELNVLATENVVLVREDDPWPRTKIANGRMTLIDGGGVAIPIVQKKRTVEDRAFAPMKWLFGASNDDIGAAAGATRVFAPGAWHLSGSRDIVPITAPATSASPSPKPAVLDVSGICALGPWPLDGSIPILNATTQILDEVGSARGGVQRAIVLLPPEDLDLATDPRVYRVVLDALLARLAKAGVRSVVLITPFRFGCNDAHRKALWREVHESAAANAVRAVDPNDWMHEAQWRADPGTPNVYATRPNAPGRKIIEQALANLIR